MRPTSRFVRVVAAVGAVALLATACGGDDDGEPSGEETSPADQETTEEPADGETADGEEQAGGSFSVYICEPQHLIPTNTNETCGSEVLNAVFSGLVTYDPETADPQWGEDAPRAMAASIESDDQQTWTITLKEGWTFHNGDPVTAQSFVDSWNFGANSANAQGNSYFFENIEGYDALQAEEEGAEPEATEMTGLTVVDDTTFEVTLAEPFSQFPLTVGYTAFYPMPSEAFEDPAAYEEAPIGNGPYQVSEDGWQHDEEIVVNRYADYAGEPGSADSVEFRIYAEISTAYNDLLAGSLDVMDTLPPEQVPQAEQQFGDRYIQATSSSYTHLTMPSYSEELTNDDIGRALSMAIDRQAITDTIRPGDVPADGIVSPVVQGYREGSCGDGCEFDPDQAAELYEQAGGLTEPVTLWFNSGAGHEEWIEAVANQWRDNLGIQDIQFESLQFADYLDRLEAEEVDGPFRLGWVMDYPSIQNYLEPLHSSNGSANFDGYSNEEVDQLIDEANAAPSLDDALPLYHEAQDLIQADWHHIPMFFGRVDAAYSENVSGVIVDPFTQINTADIEVVG